MAERTHVVMARFSPSELERLDALRSIFKMSRAKYMRTRALGERMPQDSIAPALNRQAWVELSRSASNLNQIAKRMNMKMAVTVNEIAHELSEFRAALIGAARFEPDDEAPE